MKLFISYQAPSGMEIRNKHIVSIYTMPSVGHSRKQKNIILVSINVMYMLMLSVYQSIMYLIILNRMFYRKGYCYSAACVQLSLFCFLLTEVDG